MSPRMRSPEPVEGRSPEHVEGAGVLPESNGNTLGSTSGGTSGGGGPSGPPNESPESSALTALLHQIQTERNTTNPTERHWRIGRLINNPDPDPNLINNLVAGLARRPTDDNTISHRDLLDATRFYSAYPDPDAEPLAIAFQLPWRHTTAIINRVRKPEVRPWYLRHALHNQWNLKTLHTMIDTRAHRQPPVEDPPRREQPPDNQPPNARILRHPCRFDFVQLDEPFTEGDLERALVRRIEPTLATFGEGHAFLGRQVILSIGRRRHRADLLLYHTIERRHVVVELKRGNFHPEHAGKLNLYCHLTDQLLRQPGDAATRGIILCERIDRDLVTAALNGMSREIHIGAYTVKPPNHR